LPARLNQALPHCCCIGVHIMPKINELHVNGKRYPIDAEADASLLFVLRDQLDLTGSKYGCGEGMCGACTVWVDGTPRRSCITGVGSVAGKQITTIEGLAANGRLHPLQQAFLDVESFQCAYCASGMIMSGAALLRSNPNPSEQDIVRFMQGNVCRCGTHPRIVAAIRRAAEAMRKSGA
jgi:isoquinoline 1-oxidoreductase subunit alpha